MPVHNDMDVDACKRGGLNHSRAENQKPRLAFQGANRGPEVSALRVLVHQGLGHDPEPQQVGDNQKAVLVRRKDKVLRVISAFKRHVRPDGELPSWSRFAPTIACVLDVLSGCVSIYAAIQGNYRGRTRFRVGRPSFFGRCATGSEGNRRLSASVCSFSSASFGSVPANRLRASAKLISSQRGGSRFPVVTTRSASCRSTGRW